MQKYIEDMYILKVGNTVENLKPSNTIGIQFKCDLETD